MASLLIAIAIWFVIKLSQFEEVTKPEDKDGSKEKVTPQKVEFLK